MKKKLIRIGLFLMVLAVWGAIWGKVYTKKESLAVEIAPLPVKHTYILQEPQKLPEQFVFDRDPFLGRSIRSKKKPSSSAGTKRRTSTIKTPPKVVQKEPSIIWPNMKLQGFVTPNINETASVAIILFKNREILVSTGNTIEGINIQEIGPYKVILEQQGETKTLIQE